MLRAEHIMHYGMMLGRRQMASQETLDLPSGGSSPPAPANKDSDGSGVNRYVGGKKDPLRIVYLI